MQRVSAPCGARRMPLGSAKRVCCISFFPFLSHLVFLPDIVIALTSLSKIEGPTKCFCLLCETLRRIGVHPELGFVPLPRANRMTIAPNENARGLNPRAENLVMKSIGICVDDDLSEAVWHDPNGLNLANFGKF